MSGMANLRKEIALKVTNPIINLLAKTGLTPNMVTVTGFIITLVAAGIIVNGNLLLAGIVMLLAGVFDMLDGALARRTGKVTRFGAVLDSTLDRVSEAAILIGVCAFYSQSGQTPEVVLAVVTLTLSLLVSYIRARAEAMGLEGKEGFFTRPERVVVLAIGMMFNILVPVLVLVSVLSLITVIQRLANVYRQTK
ncbi:MAG: CDP-alcohol phosphatidyltransferase [Dehalococcoides mccartyi]|uniref:CDP-alcohol phosphatidyltransferase family protein n=1 Tax=Dehalococcoides mccartyi TaxID=61435 RepID=UPI0029D9AE01|nr:CDP-alcohol phosphatidyltransferase [Dehalococcoides mccartyi]MEA2121802.1 Phosphatidylinositol phosphate synthase [Dehalococcoides mccartyi]MEA2122337.1 Phosphatidylinositol phosphate synthase [Dehalococcoides mccartyi]